MDKIKAVILGNSPSLLDFLIKESQLKNALIFGVNRIYEFKTFPLNLDYYVALDKTLWKTNKEDIFKLKAKKYCVYERYQEYAKESFHSSRLEILKYTQDPFTFSIKEKNLVGHGYSSVFAATQLAVQRGAKEIEFFGVDYCLKGTKSHFFGTRHRSQKFWDFGMAGMLKIFQECSSLGICVKINTINPKLKDMVKHYDRAI